MTTRGQLSVAERAPYLVVEWHPDRNGDLTADRVSYGTNKPIWWRCQKCGHEWLSAPRTRIRSTETTSSRRIMGCPSCSKFSARNIMQVRANKRHATSLRHRPDLLEEFHKSKNSDVGADRSPHGTESGGHADTAEVSGGPRSVFGLPGTVVLSAAGDLTL
ncbi:zinc-ribbon domain-containing protein [Rhodococcus jostii]|uniref:zinc-ribbon domain-containing protein n=1 Tax=Rhodococcus jostii TaxID=132919 RepID=UPI0039829C45